MVHAADCLDEEVQTIKESAMEKGREREKEREREKIHPYSFFIEDEDDPTISKTNPHSHNPESDQVPTQPKSLYWLGEKGNVDTWRG